MKDDLSAKHTRRHETEAKLRSALTLACGSGEKISISAIARAAGVSASLIHTKYPAIAVEIRAHIDIPKRDEVERLRVRLAEQEESNRALQDEIRLLRNDLASVVSANATLMHEIAVLKATTSGKVTAMRTS